MVYEKFYQRIVHVFAMVIVFLSWSRNCAGTLYNVGGFDPAGKLYNVGGFDSGFTKFTWYDPHNTTFYQDWADRITFFDNDSLAFSYNYSLHNICVVETLAEFNACSVVVGGTSYSHHNTSGVATLTLPENARRSSASEPKPLYFFSTFSSSDCANGMKFKLYNYGSLAARSLGATAPSPGADVTKRKKKGFPRAARTVLIAVGVALLIATISQIVRRIIRGKRNHKVDSCEGADWARRKEALTCTIYNFEELDRATNKFSMDNRLGSGGFGTVYKGTLDNGTIVAVKRTNNLGGNDKDQFLNEVSILSQVNSRYLAKLLGCCVELDVPLLVFEFISNGTVQEHLVNAREGHSSKLDWATRFRIAIQTAEALKYLHFQASPPIFHRDVKTANILLDGNFNVKVADFGLSKLVDMDKTHVSTLVKGTPGYLDPEYYHNFQLTDKTDVYSFGMVLLELLTSKKPVDLSREPRLQNLAMATIPAIRAGRTREIVDPTLISESFAECDYAVLEGVAQISAACLGTDRASRPSMKEVVDLLQNLQSGTSPTAQGFMAKTTFISMDDDIHVRSDDSYNYLFSQRNVATMNSDQATSSSSGLVELSCTDNRRCSTDHETT